MKLLYSSMHGSIHTDHNLCTRVIVACSTEAIKVKGKTMPINGTALETTVLYEATTVLYGAHECYMTSTSGVL